MKNIIITGGASGLGKAIAYKLRDNKLILIGRNENNLVNVSSDLACDYFVCDLTNPDEISKLFENINEKYENIDCLINCAGIWTAGEMSNLLEPMYKEMNEINRLKEVIDTNIFGTIAMIENVFPIMKNQGHGQIININSQSGVVVEPPFPVYNATKHSTTAFRKAVQDDLARNNIRITDVCPGLMQTDFFTKANNPLPQSVMDTGLDPDDVANIVKYIFDLPEEITIPSIEIKHIKNS